MTFYLHIGDGDSNTIFGRMCGIRCHSHYKLPYIDTLLHASLNLISSRFFCYADTFGPAVRIRFNIRLGL